VLKVGLVLANAVRAALANSGVRVEDTDSLREALAH